MREGLLIIDSPLQPFRTKSTFYLFGSSCREIGCCFFVGTCRRVASFSSRLSRPFFFFLIFGSILWRKGNVCFSKKRLREENRKFSVEFLELKMNFDYSGPRLFYANWREPVARSVTNNCLPRFSIV